MSVLKKSCGCLFGSLLLIAVLASGGFLVLGKLGQMQKEMREEQELYQSKFLPEFKNLGVVVHEKEDNEPKIRVQYLAVDSRKIKSRWEIVVLINKFLDDDILLDEVRITKTDEGFESTLESGYLKQWFGETKYARSIVIDGVRYAIPLGQESIKLFPEKRERLDAKPPMND